MPRIRPTAPIEQLTEDHSLLNGLVQLTEEEIAFPRRASSFDAGMKDSVKVDSKLDHPNPGDIYLCSTASPGPVHPMTLRLVEENKNDLQCGLRSSPDPPASNGPDNITRLSHPLDRPGERPLSPLLALPPAPLRWLSRR